MTVTENMTNVAPGGIVADFGQGYSPEMTCNGSISATTDPVQVALAVKSLQLATKTMDSQFGRFLTALS